MKIKTITCHDVYNAGASLQAYALQTYLSMLGHDVQIIHYKPDYLFDYRLWGCNHPQYNKPILRTLYSLQKFPKRLAESCGKKKKAFDAFRKQYLHLTEEKYTSINALRKHPPVADVYFAGSDQIWNTLFPNGRDTAFYLDFGNEHTVKASYAASFATDTIEEVYLDFVKAEIQKLDYVSVRESSGLRILEGMGIQGGCCVVDPVFLLDADIWQKLIPQKKAEEPYVLVYSFGSDDLMNRYASELAKQNRLKIYSLREGFGDVIVKDFGPIEFLQLIYNADYVLSNSFHATAFSILFHKEFFVFNRKENINTRMYDLTSALGLTERMIKSDNAFTTGEKIDYTDVDGRLQQYIIKSKRYITSVLKSANDNA